MPNPSTFPPNEEAPAGKELPSRNHNRAFRYGDGLFETILVRKGQVWNAESHLKRMLDGMNTLGFSFKREDWQEKMSEVLHQLQSTIPVRKFGRIRIQVFRSGGGAYLPETDEPEYVSEFSVLETDPWDDAKPITIGVYEDIKLSYSILSSVKSINALPYVLAARHARQQGWDDAVLLAADGNVAETSKSNLFIVKNSRLITPPLQSACLPGTMRAEVIKLCGEVGYEITEENVSLTDLATADEVFLSNAIRGLVPVEKTGNGSLKNFSDKVRPTLMNKLRRIR
jgi:branched-chain amino acid aminotransferase